MAAADVSAVPVVVYNVPSRTAVDLLPATVSRLAQHPRIVAIKDASAALSRVRELLSACPAGFAVLSGDDATALEWYRRRGARRHLGVGQTSHPGAPHEACMAALGGDLAAARTIDGELQAPAQRSFRRGQSDCK